MSEPTEQIRPPLLDETDAIAKLQQISMVHLWCTKGRPNHWITSYKYTNPIEVAPQKKHEGVSFNMYRPLSHVFHPTPDNQQLHGCLTISGRPVNLLLSRNSGFHRAIQLQTTITVGQAIDLVTANGLQYYKFHPDNSGCLYWQLQLLRYFVAKGWLTQAEYETIYQEVETYAGKVGEQWVRFPPVEGTRYSPPQSG